jgi:hypothetical protein
MEYLVFTKVKDSISTHIEMGSFSCLEEATLRLEKLQCENPHEEFMLCVVLQ